MGGYAIVQGSLNIDLVIARAAPARARRIRLWRQL